MELLHELGIEPRVLAVNAVAFLVVAYLLNRYFFGPFGEFLAQRRAGIEQQMTEGERAREAGRQALAEMQASREQMRAAVAEEAEEERRRAREEARQIVTDAHEAARQRRDLAEQVLGREAQELRQGLRGEVASLATDIARTALGRTLGPGEREQAVEAAVQQIERLAQERAN